MTPGYVIMDDDLNLWKFRDSYTVWFTVLSHAELYWLCADYRADDPLSWRITPYDLDEIKDRTDYLDGLLERRSNKKGCYKRDRNRNRSRTQRRNRVHGGRTNRKGKKNARGKR